MTEKIALLPAFEPEASFLHLLWELRKEDFQCVIVDDGSGPAYEDLFSDAEFFGEVLHHDRNRGKGAALKTGLAYIEEQFGPDHVVVTMDADGQHSVKDAERLVETVWQDPGTLVLGSRSFSGNVPARSRMGNFITRKVYHLFTGQKIYDTQTGLRAFSAAMIPDLLSVEGQRYEYEMNVLMIWAKKKRSMKEVPIETIYLNGNASSHFDSLRDSFRIYREILKFSAASFLSFLLDYGLYAAFLALGGLFSMGDRVLLSNISARIISASFNFVLNRRLVFESKGDLKTDAVKYGLLAGTVLLLNTLLLEILTSVLRISPMPAKVITEILLFTMNFVIQRTVVFRGKAPEGRVQGREAMV